MCQKYGLMSFGFNLENAVTIDMLTERCTVSCPIYNCDGCDDIAVGVHSSNGSVPVKQLAIPAALQYFSLVIFALTPQID